MSDDEGNNLLSPGAEHARQHAVPGVLHRGRCARSTSGRDCCARSIASAGNDHRLGANEAPPAILSIFLGDMLTDIFEQIEKGGAKSTKQRRRARHRRPRCCRSCRATRATATAPARSRSPATSSSSARCRRTRASRYPNIALNVAVTESLDYMATELEKATKGGKTLDEAVAALLPKVIKENKRIIFNGNNYSEEWEKGSRQARAAEPEEHAWTRCRSSSRRMSSRAFEKYKILNEREAARALRRSWSRPTTRRSTSKAS